jgi:hypothetical protein
LITVVKEGPADDVPAPQAFDTVLIAFAVLV